jgi:hypothetical protein
VAQESEAELCVAADTVQAVLGDRLDVSDRGATQVGKLCGFEIAEYLLGWIELRRVGRQAFDRQPRAVVVDPVGHVATAVGRQTIPQQHRPAARFELVQIGQELNQAFAVVGARTQVKHEMRVTCIGVRRPGRPRATAASN